ncbi:MAG: hypothetical protein MR982_13100, partial [Bacteroides pyogenes]|uniref:hypothetical protein n=1 Tax=Bacteroides pyogenes TaxID=310300 RepID=UPI00242C5316
ERIIGTALSPTPAPHRLLKKRRRALKKRRRALKKRRRAFKKRRRHLKKRRRAVRKLNCAFDPPAETLLKLGEAIPKKPGMTYFMICSRRQNLSEEKPQHIVEVRPKQKPEK